MIFGSEGPCISILQPVPTLTPRTHRQARLKRAIQSVEQILSERLVDPSRQSQLLEPLYEFEGGEPASEQEPGGGFVIFRSPKIFQRFYVSCRLEETVTVADHFYILPLIPIFNSGKTFYILALSQKHIRLLRCADSTEEVPFPQHVPRTLEEAIQIDQPDHVLDNRSASGPATGAMKGVMFGTGSMRETKDEYLLHFYRQVDQGLHELLRNDEAPVVLAGVEYEQALYRRVSGYRNLAAGGIQGAADGFKGVDLRRRAEPLAKASFDAPLEQALRAYEKLGAEQRSSDWKEVVKAAFQGRVAHLFLTEGAREFGVFDAATQTVDQHDPPGPQDEDLVNAAAVETLLHGGLVDILPPDKAPDGANVAALLRY